VNTNENERVLIEGRGIEVYISILLWLVGIFK